jgi:diguanylate cyclase (GGDEF)-like protein
VIAGAPAHGHLRKLTRRCQLAQVQLDHQKKGTSWIALLQKMNNFRVLAGFATTCLLGAIIGWFGWRARIVRAVARRTRDLKRELAQRHQRETAMHSVNDELEQRVSERTAVLEARNRELNAVRIELEMANARLRQLTIVDPLTGIANRRAFDQALASEVRRARRERQPVSLILCDIDGFKAYNDSYGHAKGDETLRHVARVVALTFRRAGDLAARYGGEEFGVILPGVAAREALLYAERLRRNVWRQSIAHDRAPVGSCISLSAGVASLELTAHATAEDLLKAADQALYRAKSEGRNRVALPASNAAPPATLERAS